MGRKKGKQKKSKKQAHKKRKLGYIIEQNPMPETSPSEILLFPARGQDGNITTIECRCIPPTPSELPFYNPPFDFWDPFSVKIPSYWQ